MRKLTAKENELVAAFKDVNGTIINDGKAESFTALVFFNNPSKGVAAWKSGCKYQSLNEVFPGEKSLHLSDFSIGGTIWGEKLLPEKMREYNNSCTFDGGKINFAITVDGEVISPDDPAKKKVLWFSRHDMTPDQREALGGCEITQVSKSIQSAYELKDEIDAADVIAIVAPINLQAQFLKLAGDKPVIQAVADRFLVPQEDGTEEKAVFRFVKWQRIRKIEVVVEDFSL